MVTQDEVTMNPRMQVKTAIAKALGSYMSKKVDVTDIEIYPDPQVDGVWAARYRPWFQCIAEGYLVDVSKMYVAPGTQIVIAEVQDEVEFTSWPPTSGYIPVEVYDD